MSVRDLLVEALADDCEGQIDDVVIVAIKNGKVDAVYESGLSQLETLGALEYAKSMVVDHVEVEEFDELECNCERCMAEQTK